MNGRRSLSQTNINANSSSTSSDKEEKNTANRAVGFNKRKTQSFDNEQPSTEVRNVKDIGESQESDLTAEARSSQSQSQSSQEEIVSPSSNSRGLKRTLSHASTFFSAAGGEPVRKKAKSSKRQLVDAFNEFYESKEFGEVADKTGLTADMFYQLAHICSSADILDFAKGSSDKASARKKENKMRNQFIDGMKMEAYVISGLLGLRESQQELDALLVSNLNTYFVLIKMILTVPDQSPANLEMIGKTKVLLTRAFRANKNLTYQTLSVSGKGLLNQFDAYVVEFFANQNGLTGSTEAPEDKVLIRNFFIRHLQHAKLRFDTRSPEFTLCLLHKLGQVFAENTIYVPGDNTNALLARMLIAPAAAAGYAPSVALFTILENKLQPRSSATSATSNSDSSSTNGHGLRRTQSTFGMLGCR
jgi:hypothetical protein